MKEIVNYKIPNIYVPQSQKNNSLERSLSLSYQMNVWLGQLGWAGTTEAFLWYDKDNDLKNCLSTCDSFIHTVPELLGTLCHISTQRNKHSLTNMM